MKSILLIYPLLFTAVNSQLSCDEASYVDRVEWGARKPSSITNLTSQPLSFYVIHHSETPPCYDDVSCVERVKGIQYYHQIGRGWVDIGYHFLVGENGKAYEGRGWNREAAHSLEWNNDAYGICIIGNFTMASPNEKASNAIRSLIDCGVKSGHVKENYYVITHRQSQRPGYTECPGDGALGVLSKWPRYCSFQNSGAPLKTNQTQISLALDFCEKEFSSTASSSTYLITPLILHCLLLFYFLILKAYPNMWTFIKCVQNEENRFRQLLLQMNAGAQARKKTAATSFIQKRIDTLNERYKNGEIDVDQLLDGFSLPIAKQKK
ncbi:unnamed protein product [Rotaria magnacalcarata]|uniref:Uncharacterized protein n=4 Tax=Rotaria magnacalcarata TaxID=392030 RepID=A0A814GXP8_9BILA|nr:unnamed protein product [Rotaria magnacalcarata]